VTIQQKIFAIIKAAGKPVDVGYVRERIAMDNPIRVSDALGRLRRSGWIKLTGSDRVAFYTVARKGDPQDMRGRCMGSKKALREHGNSVKGGLRSAILRGQHPKPKATTELERVWGWLPLVSQQLRAED
jgi:hypothetical protein